MKGDFVMVYVTTGSREEAEMIGEEVVKLRLAACANVLGDMSSIYWWEEKMEKASEAVLILKTMKPLIEEVISKIKALHSYETPCILVYPVVAGSGDYLRWIERETSTVREGAR